VTVFLLNVMSGGHGMTESLRRATNMVGMPAIRH
jgi:hypothetical protein